MQFASRQAVGGDPLGVKRVKIIAWADNDRLRLKGPAAGLKSRRRGAQSDRLAAGTSHRGAQQDRQPGAGSPRATRRGFRAGYRGPRRRIATAGPFHKSRYRLARRGGTPAPSRWRETLRGRSRASDRLAIIRSPRCTTAIPAASATSAQTSRERRARRQHSPACLARDGDEAEIPDRGAVGLPVAIDHDDPLSSPGGRQSMRQSANAGADNGDIEGTRGWRHQQSETELKAGKLHTHALVLMRE